MSEETNPGPHEAHVASVITETLRLSNPADDLTKLTEELGLYDHQPPANPSEPV